MINNKKTTYGELIEKFEQLGVKEIGVGKDLDKFVPIANYKRVAEAFELMDKIIDEDCQFSIIF